MHVEAAAAEYVPVAQLVHAVRAPFSYVPHAQFVHTVDVVDPVKATTFPAAHNVQSLEVPATSAYLPAGHVTHDVRVDSYIPVRH